MALIAENELKPDLEQLDRAEFNLDVEESNRLMVQGNEKAQEVSGIELLKRETCMLLAFITLFYLMENSYNFHLHVVLPLIMLASTTMANYAVAILLDRFYDVKVLGVAFCCGPRRYSEQTGIN